jgi:hypothetical protein
MEIKISLNLTKCRMGNGVTCPYSDTERTHGAGFALDYLCKLVPENNEHGFRKTSGYVEWESDVNPVPEWCPLRADREDIILRKIDKILGEGI